MAKDLTGYSKRQDLDVLRTQLDLDRSSFIQHWRSLSDYITPRRPRFDVTDVNRGDRRNQHIIDSTATFSVRTLRSGMMSGITSPARPWFRLTTPDPKMAEQGEVKEWLQFVTERMSAVFLKSNLYNVLPIVYGDLGVFGTSAMQIEEDFENVVRFYPFPIGSYMISNNERLIVDTFRRDFRMTVRQIVKKFGAQQNREIDWTNISQTVKNLWDNSHYEAWVDVCHVVRPNDEYDQQKALAKFKRYSSCYYEEGYTGASQGGNYMTESSDRFLRESGYDLFPVLAPRWEITGEDSYATDCPGMTALGDIKALQTMQKRKAQAVEKMINPPMVGPSALKTTKTSILPGDITYSDEREGQKGFRPAHEVQLRIEAVTADIQEHQRRIQRAFYEDLFLMLASSDRRQITAREIDERHEEKLLALGPVLEQLNQDVLDPLIDNTFDIMVRQGLVPPAPRELQGQPLRVEYVSVMAQAQKLVGISGIERFAGFVGQIVTVTQNPTVMDKVDVDQMLDEYGDAVGVGPRIVRSDEKVAAIRDGRAKQEQAQAAMAAIQQGAQTAKDLSGASLDGDNALSRMIDDSGAGSLVSGQ